MNDQKHPEPEPWKFEVDDKDRRIIELESELAKWKERYVSAIDAMELQYQRTSGMYNRLRKELYGDENIQSLKIDCPTCGASTSGWCNNCGHTTIPRGKK